MKKKYAILFCFLIAAVGIAGYALRRQERHPGQATAAARDTEDLQVVPRGKNQACRLEVLVYCLAGADEMESNDRFVDML